MIPQRFCRLGYGEDTFRYTGWTTQCQTRSRLHFAACLNTLIPYLLISKNSSLTLAGVAPLVGMLSRKPGGSSRLDSQSGHMPRLCILSLVRECTRGKPTDVFLSPSLFLSPPSTFPLSRTNKHVFG